MLLTVGANFIKEQSEAIRNKQANTKKLASSIFFGFMATLITSCSPQSLNPSPKAANLNCEGDQSKLTLIQKNDCEKDQEFNKLPSFFKNYLTQDSGLNKDDLLSLYQYKNPRVINLGDNNLGELSNEDFLELAKRIKGSVKSTGEDIAKILLYIPEKDFQKLTDTQTPVAERATNFIQNNIKSFPTSMNGTDIISAYSLQRKYDLDQKKFLQHLPDLLKSMPRNWNFTNIKEALNLISEADSKKFQEIKSFNFQQLSKDINEFSKEFTDKRFIQDPNAIFTAMEILDSNIDDKGLKNLNTIAKLMNAFYTQVNPKYSISDIKNTFENLPSYLEIKNLEINNAKKSGQEFNNLLESLNSLGFKNENINNLFKESTHLVFPNNDGYLQLSTADYTKKLEKLIKGFDKEIYTPEQITTLITDFKYDSIEILDKNLKLNPNQDPIQKISLLSKILSPYFENNGSGIYLTEHEELKKLTVRFTDKNLAPLDKEISSARMNEALIQKLKLKQAPDILEESTRYKDIAEFLGHNYKSFDELMTGYTTIKDKFLNQLPRKTSPEKDQEPINLKEVIDSYEVIFKDSLKGLTAEQRLNTYINLINNHTELTPTQALRLAQIQESSVFSDIQANSPTDKQNKVLALLEKTNFIRTTNCLGSNTSRCITNFNDYDLLALIKGVGEPIKFQSPDLKSTKILEILKEKTKGQAYFILPTLLNAAGIDTSSNSFQNTWNTYKKIDSKYFEKLSGDITSNDQGKAITKLIMANISPEEFTQYIDNKASQEKIDFATLVSNLTKSQLETENKDFEKQSQILNITRYDQLKPKHYQHAIEIITGKENIKDKKGIVIIGLPTTDEGMAFSYVAPPIVDQLIKANYAVIPFQVQKDTDLIEIPSKIKALMKIKNYDHMIISGHGNPNGITINNSNNEQKDRFSIEDIPIIQKFKTLIIPKGSLVILGCSTAADNNGKQNLEQTIQKANPQARTDAPAFDATPLGLNLEVLKKESRIEIMNLDANKESSDAAARKLLSF
ncbi:MAG: hypothetical protein ACKO3R_07590 [bacterium]